MKSYKLILILIVLTILVIVFSYYYISKSNFVLRETYASPDGTYLVDLYVEKKMKPQLSFTGDSDHKKAYIVLKNKEGAVLAEPSLFNSCHFVMGDFYLDWDEADKIYFTKFNFIDLESMKMNCK